MHLYIEDIYLDELKDFTEKLDKVSKDEEINIYICSNWWAVPIMEQYLRIINKLENPCSVFAYKISSCAFELFRKINKTKDLSTGAYSVYHAMSWEIDMMNKDIAKWKSGKFKLSILKDIEPLPFLTDEENNDYVQWNDIYLGEERLRTIFWF